MKTTSAVALIALTLCSATAQAQSCPCNGGSGTLISDPAVLTTLLSNKMVCAAVGSERWQEWHNGSASGVVVDYKKGPGDGVDPSSVVGSYTIGNVAGGSGGVRYSYGSTSYTYAVCQTTGAYAFCGAPYGGRNIVNATVSASAGLQSCANVSNAALPTTPGVQAPTRTGR